jgi:hypothetical protein
MDYEICDICGAERNPNNLTEGSCTDVAACLHRSNQLLKAQLLETNKVLHAMAEVLFSPANSINNRRTAEQTIRDWMNQED